MASPETVEAETATTQEAVKANQGQVEAPDIQITLSACLVHWKFGKGAWMCTDRHNCLWRDFESPRPRHNRNIVAVAEKVD